MPDFESKTTIAAPAQAVFDFVSDVKNVPSYTPTVKRAESAGEGRIHVRSEVEDKARETEGFFHVKGPEDRLEWGSESNKDYHGWMQIRDAGNGQSELTIHLRLNPPPQTEQDVEQRSGQDFEQKMQEGVERALDSIKNHLEGTGGKNEIPESR